MAACNESFDISEEAKDISMLVVMGVTGAGKSHFINQLAGVNITEEGQTLKACTDQCRPVLVELGGKSVVVVDTPGFDDGNRSDAEILTEIARVLTAQHQLGVRLRGVIYMHRITDVRYGGYAVKTFEILKRICGDASLRNVMLVTSMWSQIDEKTGSRRETELRKNYWPYMLDRGSSMNRFYGHRPSAIAVVSQLLTKVPVVLSMQLELLNNGNRLENTAVWAYLRERLEALKQKHQETIRKLETLIRQGFGGDSSHRREVENDVAKEKDQLLRAEQLQAALDRPIEVNVDGEISRGLRMRQILRASAPYIVPVASVVFNILCAIIGIPLPIPLG